MASSKPILSGALNGAVFGFVIAVLAVTVGAIRALVAIAGGHTFDAISDYEIRFLGYYVGGFIVAGALVGAAGPLLPGRLGTYVRFAFGGLVVMLAIAIADNGSLAALDTVDWIVVCTVGPALGLGGAYGYLKTEIRRS